MTWMYPYNKVLITGCYDGEMSTTDGALIFEGTEMQSLLRERKAI